MNKEEPRATPDSLPGIISNPSERYKAVTRDLTQKALEIVNRISIQEMSKEKPEVELFGEHYLLHHSLDFLKRFVEAIESK